MMIEPRHKQNRESTMITDLRLIENRKTPMTFEPQIGLRMRHLYSVLSETISQDQLERLLNSKMRRE